MAETLTSDHAQTLLAGVDTAFEAVLQGRYGGGVTATLAQPEASTQTFILRTARAGTHACLCLHLEIPGAQDGAATDGVKIGIAQLNASPRSSVMATTVQTEIFVDHDPNESGDATAQSSGVLLQNLPVSLPNGGLLVVRSTEAARNHEQLALAGQQNWRPNPSRHVASTGLGASGRGHRQAGPTTMQLPVSADLLARLGSAAAALPIGIGKVSVVLLPTGLG